jgi:hypothetical protein
VKVHSPDWPPGVSPASRTSWASRPLREPEGGHVCDRLIVGGVAPATHALLVAWSGEALHDVTWMEKRSIELVRVDTRSMRLRSFRGTGAVDAEPHDDVSRR